MKKTPSLFPMPGRFKLNPVRDVSPRLERFLIASPHFVLERIDLPANSNWALDADRETWILVIEGQRADRVDEYVGRRRRLY